MTLQAPLSSKTILVADDDTFYQDVAHAALSGAGYRVVQAHNGEECLARVATERVDIALLDLTMPVADGFAVLRRLRAEAHTVNLPVVVVTGMDDSPSIERAYRAGATSFLVKPLNWSLLPHHVDYVLRNSRTEANLRDAMRTADFLSRLKSGFMAVLARELRKPLHGIRGSIQSLKADARAQPNIIGDIESASDSMDRTVLKLLHLGSMLSDEVLLLEKRVALDRLIAEAIESCTTAATHRGVRLVADLSFAGPVDIVCDPALVSQAIRCLIDNAVAFSPRGASVVVRARIGATSELSLVVEDSAPALPKEAIRRILDRPDAPVPAGSAMMSGRDVGLSVSRILAEAHQGSLGIKAALDKGNIAILALPPSRVVRSGPKVASGHVH